MTKCQHLDTECKWRMRPEHCKGFEYLNDACYLSGSFTLDCPDQVVANGKINIPDLRKSVLHNAIKNMS